jgi:hypothetical protein
MRRSTREAGGLREGDSQNPCSWRALHWLLRKHQSLLQPANTLKGVKKIPTQAWAAGGVSVSNNFAHNFNGYLGNGGIEFGGMWWSNGRFPPRMLSF